MADVAACPRGSPFSVPVSKPPPVQFRQQLQKPPKAPPPPVHPSEARLTRGSAMRFSRPMEFKAPPVGFDEKASSSSSPGPIPAGDLAVGAPRLVQLDAKAPPPGLRGPPEMKQPPPGFSMAPGGGAVSSGGPPLAKPPPALLGDPSIAAGPADALSRSLREAPPARAKESGDAAVAKLQTQPKKPGKSPPVVSMLVKGQALPSGDRASADAGTAVSARLGSATDLSPSLAAASSSEVNGVLSRGMRDAPPAKEQPTKLQPPSTKAPPPGMSASSALLVGAADLPDAKAAIGAKPLSIAVKAPAAGGGGATAGDGGEPDAAAHEQEAQRRQQEQRDQLSLNLLQQLQQPPTRESSSSAAPVGPQPRAAGLVQPPSAERAAQAAEQAPQYRGPPGLQSLFGSGQSNASQQQQQGGLSGLFGQSALTRQQADNGRQRTSSDTISAAVQALAEEVLSKESPRWSKDHDQVADAFPGNGGPRIGGTSPTSPLQPGLLGLNPTAPEWFPSQFATGRPAEDESSGNRAAVGGGRQRPDTSPPVPPGVVSVGAAAAVAEAAAVVSAGARASGNGLLVGNLAARVGLLDLETDHPPEVLKMEIQRQRQEIAALRSALARTEAGLRQYRWAEAGAGGPRPGLGTASR